LVFDKSDLWRQIKADVTGLPVRVPTNVETTATGAAILAGQYERVADAVEAFVSYEPRENVPDPDTHEEYIHLYSRYRELYYAVKPLSR
jgi:sugar (pentulose or hexulose) kinase